MQKKKLKMKGSTFLVLCLYSLFALSPFAPWTAGRPILFCPSPLALPAPQESIKVALFSPYKIESITVKIDHAPVWISHTKDGTDIIKVEAGREFRLTATNSRIRVSGLPYGRSDLLAHEIRLRPAGLEKGFIEITTPSLSPQKFKGVIHARAEGGRLVLIEEAGLEDYLAGVVLYEAADGRHSEALKAHAIVSRTFAARNLKRHGRAYDLCSSTHCQVYKGYVAEGHTVVSAVRATAGIVLQHRGRLIDAHYSANCGGQTAEAGEIWPSGGRAYRSSVRDDYCSGSPHSSWRFRVENRSLWKALKSDARTDPGLYLRQIRILNYGPSGRATRVAIEGEQRRVIDGWQFRQVVTRSLGWGSIKSSLFKVVAAGKDFIFEGRGFGHGLGLCQTGAERMAEQGFSSQEILRHYYPQAKMAAWKTSPAMKLVPLLFRQPDLRVRSSEHFIVKFTGEAEAGEIERLLELLESIRAGYQRRTGHAPDQPTEVIVHPSTAAFTQATGRPWWVAAVTREAIEVQPLRTLQARGILQSTLRHEYAHIIIKTAARHAPPLWLAEGFAIYLAVEGERLRPPARETLARVSQQGLDAILRNPADKDQMQVAYYLAYRRVRTIISEQGEDGIWNLLRQSD